MFNIEAILWFLGALTVVAGVIIVAAVALIFSISRNFKTVDSSNPYKS